MVHDHKIRFQHTGCSMKRARRYDILHDIEDGEWIVLRVDGEKPAVLSEWLTRRDAERELRRLMDEEEGKA
jgi:hypothetical protein